MEVLIRVRGPTLLRRHVAALRCPWCGHTGMRSVNTRRCSWWLPPCVGANPGVHHDAAIHVTPTMGAPAPSPAWFLTMWPNEISRT